MLPDTYRPRRLWLQRMLNNAISSCCVRIERSKSLTVDQAALVSQQNPRKNTPAIYRISVMAYTDGSVVTKGRVQVTEVSTSSLTTGMEQNQNKTRRLWLKRVLNNAISSIVQELCESRDGRPGLSVLTSLLAVSYTHLTLPTSSTV